MAKHRSHSIEFKRQARRSSSPARRYTVWRNAVICDIRLPDISGDELFRQLAARTAVPPFLFMTAYGDIDQAVLVMRAGAGDYITKPFAIPPFIMRAQSLIQRNSQAASGAVLGSSPAMRSVEETLRRVAAVQSPVLITGETGSGKEVCARFLHRISPRRSLSSQSIAPPFPAT